MKIFTLKSSELEVIDCDRSSRVMRVRFRTGERHEYRDVPGSIFDALLSSPAKDSYFFHHIQGRFDAHRVGASV